MSIVISLVALGLSIYNYTVVKKNREILRNSEK